MLNLDSSVFINRWKTLRPFLSFSMTFYIDIYLTEELQIDEEAKKYVVNNFCDCY